MMVVVVVMMITDFEDNRPHCYIVHHKSKIIALG
jgi:hypothetical protein